MTLSKKFVSRQRKRRTLDREREAQPESSAVIQSEAVEIVPIARAEREARKKAIKEDIAKQHAHTKINRAKQKRLDKYIETKLKKEENAELMKKLANQKDLVDRTLLRSTKHLGRSREDKRETLTRALREKEACINVTQADKIIYQRRKRPEPEDGSISDSSSNSDGLEEYPTQPTTDSSIAPQQNLALPTPNRLFGSGLKRPLELDDQGKPIIKRRKRKPKLHPLLFPPPTRDPTKDDIEAEWNGFESDNQSASSESVLSGHLSDERSDQSFKSGIDSDADSDSTSETNHSAGSADSEISSLEDNLSEDETENNTEARTSAFKKWAEQLRNEAVGFTASNALSENLTSSVSKAVFVPRPKEEDPLPPECAIHLGAERTPHPISLVRPGSVQQARLALPIVAKEQEIMEAIFNHHVVIISGATGSGKTTQIPQFLFENGFGHPGGSTPGMIGVTQPRRVAAVSMANRVADQLNGYQDRVAHQIRFDTTVSSKTAIKFMTDGVLLREMSQDFSIKKYSAIIIDEAHERTVNTDILISLVSRCVTARAALALEKPEAYSPLKLIIMSATLRISDFRDNSRLFKQPPPLVKAEGRQYHVTPHWSRHTNLNYLDETFGKVSRAHKKLPPGGILVFLTGQNEIRMLSKHLRQAFASTNDTQECSGPMRVSASEMPVEGEDWDMSISHDSTHLNHTHQDAESNAESNDKVDLETHDDLGSEFDIEGEGMTDELTKIHVLPLYSQLPSKEQLRVFEQPPEGSRLIVLATNVAETSLTIPGIRYVFDTGRVKERKWDRDGVQTFQTTWISKASADQRMGRAGRTAPGHCYRLYSSAIYESFAEFAEPEIYRSPVEGVVLQLKALGIARVDNFPFPTPPAQDSLAKAETLLSHLGALDQNKQITPVGRELLNYPLGPRFAQMLRLGRLYDVIEPCIAMVAALDVPELFVPENLLDLHSQPLDEDEIRKDQLIQEELLRKARAKAYGIAQGRVSRLSSTSDAMKLLMAMIESSCADDPDLTCETLFLRRKAIKEANQLREQLSYITRNINATCPSPFTPRLEVPGEKQIAILRQILSAGFIDQVAIRADCLPSPPEVERKPRRAIDMRYQTLVPSVQLDNITTEDDRYVFLHPSSILSRLSLSKCPRYIIYHRLQRSQNTNAKTRMFPLTSVSGEQLAALARGTSLLHVGKPTGKITTLQHQHGYERRQGVVVLSLSAKQGVLGWPLTSKEVVQRRDKSGWVIEKYLN